MAKASASSHHSIPDDMMHQLLTEITQDEKCEIEQNTANIHELESIIQLQKEEIMVLKNEKTTMKQNLNKQIQALKDELEQTQYETAVAKMDNIDLTQAIESLKQKHVLLTDDMLMLHKSLINALSFSEDAMCGWYQTHDQNEVFPVKVKGNKIGYLDGTIESNKETQTAPYTLDDMAGLCQYVACLMEYTESSLSAVDMPQDDDEDEEDKSDFLWDMMDLNVPSLTTIDLFLEFKKLADIHLHHVAILPIFIPELVCVCLCL
eukprot:712670_1